MLRVYTSNRTCTDEQARQKTRSLLFKLDEFMSQFLNNGMCIFGDFNLLPDDGAMQWLTRNGMWRPGVHEFHDPIPEMACYAGNTATCIDHILIGQKLAHLQSEGWVLDGGGIRPHCPMGVEFCLKPEQVASVSLPIP
eukprot:1584428-Amphidinium_carterae.1